MKTEKINLRLGAITLIVLLAALSRLIPHPANFSPIGAMAIFGAGYYSKRYLAFLIPIASMWISDLLLNNLVYGEFFDHFVWFYKGSIFTYGAFALIVLVSTFFLKKINVKYLAFLAILSSIIFFIVSNFGVWVSSGMYPQTLEGLSACYIAGLPFLKNTIMGDFVYTAVMFGSFELSAKYIPQLQLAYYNTSR